MPQTTEKPVFKPTEKQWLKVQSNLSKAEKEYENLTTSQGKEFEDFLKKRDLEFAEFMATQGKALKKASAKWNKAITAFAKFPIPEMISAKHDKV